MTITVNGVDVTNPQKAQILSDLGVSTVGQQITGAANAADVRAAIGAAPSTGIAKTALATAVQTSLTLADNAIPSSSKGVANGVAGLDAAGKVQASQVSGLASVATSGAYADLTGRPNPVLTLNGTAPDVSGNVTVPTATAATTATAGTVRLADSAAITAGTAGRVMDAAQLKAVSDTIAGRYFGQTSSLTGMAATNIAYGSLKSGDWCVLVIQDGANPRGIYVYDINSWTLVLNLSSSSTATTSSEGLVRLADAAAVTAGTAGRVVDAAQLKAQEVLAATTGVQGKVLLASAAAITAGTAEAVVDAAQLKAINTLVGGRFMGAALSYGALPTTHATFGAIRTGDWAVLQATTGPNNRGIYRYNGTQYIVQLPIQDVSAATTTGSGVVTLADQNAIDSGTSGYVVDAAQLKAAASAATTTTTGTVRLATDADITNGIATRVVDALQTRAIKTSVGGRYIGKSNVMVSLPLTHPTYGALKNGDWAMLGADDGGNVRGTYIWNSGGWVLETALPIAMGVTTAVLSHGYGKRSSPFAITAAANESAPEMVPFTDVTTLHGTITLSAGEIVLQPGTYRIEGGVGNAGAARVAFRWYVNAMAGGTVGEVFQPSDSSTQAQANGAAVHVFTVSYVTNLSLRVISSTANVNVGYQSDNANAGPWFTVQQLPTAVAINPGSIFPASSPPP